jgi:hypothetical protein
MDNIWNYISHLSLIIIFTLINIVILLCCSRFSNKDLFNGLYNQLFELKLSWTRLKNNKSVVNILSCILLLLQLTSDPFINIIRLFSTKTMDGFQFFQSKLYTVYEYFTLGYFICMYVIWECKESSLISAVIVIWLLYTITLRKLFEFVTLGKDRPFSGYTRTVILTMINIVQLLFGFSFLYRYNQIITDINLKALLFPFYVFTRFGYTEYTVNLCPSQAWLVGFNILSFFIVITAFFTRMSNVEYKKSY